jgi:hypothetical protein
MIKRVLLSIVFLVALCNLSFATNYYVRDGGSVPANCNGLTNAVYVSSPSNSPNCAFNHPRYVMGWDSDNPQTQRWGSGDTMFIDGDSDTTPGAQAQYVVGYDDTGANGTPDCNTAFPYDCTLTPIPGGISITQQTNIIGTGTHKPMLWGNERAWQVLSMDTNYVNLQWLEVTDKATCSYSNTRNGCNYGGPYPYGQWAEDGIFLGGTGNTLTDVYVHGLGRYGIATDNVQNITFTRVWVIGNGYGGITVGNNGDTSATGTLTFNQPVIEWSGCVEVKPVTGGIDNPANYIDCHGQDTNPPGYGDGLAFGASGNENAGNWIITGPGSLSWNMQDGLDTLHGNGNGFIEIDKMHVEGNAGNQVKMNALTGSLTNSVVFGNCGWWWGSAQLNPDDDTGDICRAEGNTISYFTNAGGGNVYSFYNNTMTGNGNVQLLQNGTCDPTDILNVKNNIFIGGPYWGDDTAFNGSGGNSLVNYIYAGGQIGSNTGCNEFAGGQTVNEDYNQLYNMQTGDYWCNGSHDICGTTPQFTNGPIPMGTVGAGRTTYYNGWSGLTLVTPTASNPGVGAGISGLSFWNNSNDIYNNTQTSPPFMGAVKVSSCAASTYFCQYNSSCCSASCTAANMCSGSCGVAGWSCSQGSQCCSGICFATTCVSSAPTIPSTFSFKGALRGSLGR